MEYDFKNSNGKTGHQIKQEEKRKNKELEFKQTMQLLKIIGIVLLIGFIFIGMMAYIEQH